MKKAIIFFAFIFLAAFANAQTSDSTQIVDASCGQCNFGMKDKKGCDLAIRIDSVPYFVTGTDINKHGDSHADDGFCNAIRKAKVSGKVVEKNFVATSFVLLPQEKAKP
ncbi:MAG: hypothetical protein EOP53_06025 [Sphingobacteriales bacterium]|nr:MAG: hypothetical protein EOP53_06025 [Sphingobacteriales bacterium]